MVFLGSLGEPGNEPEPCKQVVSWQRRFDSPRSSLNTAEQQAMLHGIGMAIGLGITANEEPAIDVACQADILPALARECRRP